MTGTLLLVIVVAAALAFDFTNGFHDTANSMAAPIATGALKPKTAVTLSAILNVVGAVISIKVATTIAKGMVDTASVTLSVLLAALAGAMIWNLLTWYLGLPSSSSHALIGGLLGATIVASGTGAVNWAGFVKKVAVPAVGAVLIAGLVAALATYITYRLIQGRQENAPVTRGYRYGQIASASLMSLAHGTNDAQKTMGIITLALVANGNLPKTGFDVPTWVIIACAVTMGLGTYIGGWRIIRTLGQRVTTLEAPQGFAAQVVAATAILASSFNGYALSTTHVASGSIMGAGVGKRLAGVRWGLVGQMAGAWVITLPASAGVAAAGVGIDRAVNGGYVGAILLTAILTAVCLVIWKISRKDAVTAADVGVQPVAPAPRPVSLTEVPV
jgi:inorganic phosphate transporter, PiT family